MSASIGWIQVGDVELAPDVFTNPYRSFQAGLNLAGDDRVAALRELHAFARRQAERATVWSPRGQRYRLWFAPPAAAARLITNLEIDWRSLRLPKEETDGR